MAWKKYTSGEGVKSSENNTNEINLAKGIATARINTAIDRTPVYSSDGEDWWDEAYVDSNGRNNSVDTSNTNAIFDSNIYTASKFLGEFTEATADIGSASDYFRGLRFQASETFTKIIVTKNSSVASTACKLLDASKLEIDSVSFSGNVATFTGTFSASTNYYVTCDNSNTGYYAVSTPTFPTTNDSLTVNGGIDNGVDDGTNGFHIDTIEIQNVSDTVEIYHAIPPGTFSFTTSSSYLKALFEDYEDGASVDYKLTNLVDLGDEFLIVEASSYLGTGTGNYNCKIERISANKWIIYSTSSTAVVRRAEMYACLFNNHKQASDPASAIEGTAEILNFTSVSAVKTSESGDVGKKMFSLMLNQNNNASSDGNYTGTFTDTSTNTGVQFWSDCVRDSGSNVIPYFEAPNGTTLNTSSIEIGTDTSTDNLDNPATLDLYLDQVGTNNRWSYVSVLVLSKGDITMSQTGNTSFLAVEKDWMNDESIPTLTEATETLTSDDSGWLTENDKVSFTAFTNEPTTLIVRLNPKSTSPTAGYPSIRGVSLRAE
jgi:hypothetical protein